MKLNYTITLSETQLGYLIALIHDEVEALKGEIELTGSVTKTSEAAFASRLQNKLAKAKTA